MFYRIATVMFAVLISPFASADSDVGVFTLELPQLVAVSPSGTHVAMVAATGGNRHVLKVAPYGRGGMGQARVMDLGATPVVDVTFKGDDRVLVTVFKENVELSMTRKIDSNERGEINRPVIISLPISLEGGVILLPEKSWGTFLAAELPNDPEHVVVSARNVNNGAEDLYTVNVVTGEGEELEAGTGTWTGASRYKRYVYTTDWAITANGFAYLRVDFDEGSLVETVYGRPEGGDWERLRSYAIVEGQRPVVFGGMASATTVLAVDRGSADRRALWEYDLRTGKALRQIMTPPAGEATSPIFDSFTGELVGLAYMNNGVLRSAYTNASLKSAQAALDEAFPEYAFRQIVAHSRDKGLMVVRTEGPSQPPVWHLFDVRNMELATIATTPGLSASTLGAVETIVYPSSDGRQITAYLTLPPGGKKSGLPLIVMPHGGPEAQDDLGFEGWRQFLATRGYAVLQPQFRGSDGFGAAHEKAAHGAWGTLVQDDVSSGIQMLVAKGVVDANRMCIFGWSYGGYMALAGAALSPDLYKCAIAGAGVSDLNAMMAWTAEWTGGSDSTSYKYWQARMGDRDTRTAASPAKFAANVKIPVMLIHGEDDWVVPIEQSEIMEAALKKAGKDVVFHRYPHQAHSFQFGEESDALKKIEAFLAANLKP